MTGFAAGFNAGWGAMTQAQETKRRRAMEDEIRAAGALKPEESTGYTADQGKELEEAAKAGNTVTFDTEKNAYAITPKEGGEARFVQMGQVTDFNGNRTAGTMSPQQVQLARMGAVTDVVTKYDPLKGMQMRQQMSDSEHQQQVRAHQIKGFEREGKLWQREDKKLAKEDEYESGRMALLQNSPIAQAQAQHGAQMKEWEAGGKQGPQPVMPMMSPAQTLAGYLPLIEHDVKYGKASVEGLAGIQQKIKTLTDEGYAKTLMAAHNGADAATVAKLYNETGKDRITPEQIVIREGKDANGVPFKNIAIQTPDGVMNINTAAELSALGQLDKATALFDKGREIKRQDQQDKNEAARIGMQRQQLGMHQQKFALEMKELQESAKIPPAVKMQAQAIGEQMKSVNSALNKAMAEGQFDANSPSGKQLLEQQAALQIKFNGLLSPYTPGARPMTDPLGLSQETPQAKPTAQPAAQPTAKAPMAQMGTPQRPMSAFEQRKQKAMQDEAARRKAQTEAEAAQREEERKRILQGRPDLQQMGGARFFN